METVIQLVRHGETDWNLARRVQGHTDRPLNETGRAQAKALAAELAGEPIDAVYSSDLVRAHETATIVVAARGLEVIAMRELRERDFGTWEGLTDLDVLERFPQAQHGPWGDRETPEEMARRVVDALRRIAEAHAGRHVLVVTHGGPMRALLRRCGSPTDGPIANCHVVRLAANVDALRLLR